MEKKKYCPCPLKAFYRKYNYCYLPICRQFLYSRIRILYHWEDYFDFYQNHNLFCELFSFSLPNLFGNYQFLLYLARLDTLNLVEAVQKSSKIALVLFNDILIVCVDLLYVIKNCFQSILDFFLVLPVVSMEYLFEQIHVYTHHFKIFICNFKPLYYFIEVYILIYIRKAL